jgi:hypothetical protein
MQYLIITLVFEKNANFLAKIAEKCDHNIDPWSASTTVYHFCDPMHQLVRLGRGYLRLRNMREEGATLYFLYFRQN